MLWNYLAADSPPQKEQTDLNPNVLGQLDNGLTAYSV